MQSRYPAVFLLLASFLLFMPVVQAQSGEEWFEIGNGFFENASYQQAVDAWTKAIEGDPSLAANGYYNIGNAYIGMNEYEKAIKAWDKTLELVPGSARAYNNKGTALFLLGRNDEALQAYSNAIKIEPGNLKYRADRDNLVEQMKKPKTPLSPLIPISALILSVMAYFIRRRS